MKQPEIEVGIVTVETIHFRLNGEFHTANGQYYTGEGKVIADGQQLVVSIDGEEELVGQEIFFVPADNGTSFDLQDVTIGIQFHWERKENQRFKGKLKLMMIDGLPTAINILPLDDYLLSVISSEMSATSSIALLKAHAVISRSWLIAQKEKKYQLKEQGTYRTEYQTETEYIRWFDREDHEYFDVCADDHCQRYQGITKVSTSSAREAVEATAGEVLVYEGKICDTRFSKCCGGVSELFENVWEPVHHPYLTKVIDNSAFPVGYDLNLSDENAAEKWITGNPKAFCNTNNKEVLKQVLNDYDQETQHFFRWEVTYSQEQISDLLRRKGYDVGNVIDLIPVERGVSGRLIRLKIVGTKKTLVIGKELIIRQALSESHLYSAAFVIRKGQGNPYPETFTLMGAGWGHGVGLCQIGAAMMSEQGYTYQQILEHYFPGAKIKKRY